MAVYDGLVYDGLVVDARQRSNSLFERHSNWLIGDNLLQPAFPQLVNDDGAVRGAQVGSLHAGLPRAEGRRLAARLPRERFAGAKRGHTEFL